MKFLLVKNPEIIEFSIRSHKIKTFSKRTLRRAQRKINASGT